MVRGENLQSAPNEDGHQEELTMIFDKLDSIWLLLIIIVFMYFVFRLAKSYMYMRMRRAHRLTGVVSNFLLQINEDTPARTILISANASEQRIRGRGDDERAHNLPECRGTEPVTGIPAKLSGSHELSSATQKIRVLGFSIAMLCGGHREGTLLKQKDTSPNHKM